MVRLHSSPNLLPFLHCIKEHNNDNFYITVPLLERQDHDYQNVVSDDEMEPVSNSGLAMDMVQDEASLDAALNVGVERLNWSPLNDSQRQVLNAMS